MLLVHEELRCLLFNESIFKIMRFHEIYACVLMGAFVH
jgi:hypothetical protein